MDLIQDDLQLIKFWFQQKLLLLQPSMSWPFMPSIASLIDCSEPKVTNSKHHLPPPGTSMSHRSEWDHEESKSESCQIQCKATTNEPSNQWSRRRERRSSRGTRHRWPMQAHRRSNSTQHLQERKTQTLEFGTRGIKVRGSFASRLSAMSSLAGSMTKDGVDGRGVGRVGYWLLLWREVLEDLRGSRGWRAPQGQPWQWGRRQDDDKVDAGGEEDQGSLPLLESFCHWWGFEVERDGLPSEKPSERGRRGTGNKVKGREGKWGEGVREQKCGVDL